MPSQIAPSEESLLAEYAAANDAYMHYDNFSWQVGAVLIAGTFVFWGFLTGDTIEFSLFVVGSTLVTILMSVWMMYSHHNRQIYLCKLHRLHEIEMVLGLKQHRRWVEIGEDGEAVYRTLGPKGHELNALVYAIASLGAPLIGVFKFDAKLWPWLGLPVPLVVAILWRTRRNERTLKNYLERVKEAEQDL